jgi:hypothetical protein
MPKQIKITLRPIKRCSISLSALYSEREEFSFASASSAHLRDSFTGVFNNVDKHLDLSALSVAVNNYITRLLSSLPWRGYAKAATGARRERGLSYKRQ